MVRYGEVAMTRGFYTYVHRRFIPDKKLRAIKEEQLRNWTR